MRRKEDYDLQKVTLNLRIGDFHRLQHLHGREGAGKIIRELVIGHIKRVEEKIAQKKYLDPSNIPVEEDLV